MRNLNFQNVYLRDYYTIVGPKESEGKITNYNEKLSSLYNDEKTFESAEIAMQQRVIDKMTYQGDIDYIIGGDLLNQIAISTYSASKYNIPFIGVYSACASMIESLIIGANLVRSRDAKNVLCITSSHNLTAERQFRYPVEYGNNKPQSATTTLTAAAGITLTNEKTKYKVVSATVGKIVDMGVTDVNNMGAVMAPACAKTIYEHLLNGQVDANYYDIIVTGDLGKIGVEILKKYYKEVYKTELKNVVDAGSNIFLDSQNCYSGGSGPVCLPLYFLTKIIKSKKYKKILLVGTGSLHNPVMVNQKKTIPSIAHAISVEVQDDLS